MKASSPWEGGHPALLQQGGEGHGHAVHVEHGQQGQNVHARAGAAELGMAGLGEMGHHVPVRKAHLGYWVRILLDIRITIINRFWKASCAT